MRTLFVPAISCFIFLALEKQVMSQADESSELGALVELLTQVDDSQFQLDVLRGIQDGLQGRKNIKMPTVWPGVYKKLAQSSHDQVRGQALLLALIFGDPQAFASLQKTMMDRKAATEKRHQALQALAKQRPSGIAPLLQQLLTDPKLRGPALRNLASFQHSKTPQAILHHYASFAVTEKQDAINTLASRPAYALALLQAMEKENIPRGDLSAYSARQLYNLGDPKIREKLSRVWGTLRQTSQDKKAAIEKYQARLSPKVLRQANLSNGRLVFSRTCQQCHTLYGVGSKIGPDLTGSNRAKLNYILENVLDPSAAIGKDYRLHVLLTTEGRVLSGIIREQNNSSLTIQTVNEQIVLSKQDIEQIRPAEVSMMPEGQFDKMKFADIRDLVAYLATKSQVPFPPDKEPTGP